MTERSEADSSGGKLLIVSGPSGVGKSSLVENLMNWAETTYPDRLQLSVSYTTRQIRTGEIDGQAYHFVDENDFRRMIRQNELLEWAQVFDNFYGTGKKVVEKSLGSNFVLLEIDVQGAQQVKLNYPDSVSFFIRPPEIRELYRRLVKRGKNSDEDIELRMAVATQEIQRANDFDYQIINDNLEMATAELISAVESVIT